MLATLGLTVVEVHTSTADPVAPDASSVRTDERTFQMFRTARPLVLAQLLYRACASNLSNPLVLA